MLVCRKPQRPAGGFTLLEVLVVVILIGIIVSVVTVSATTGNLEDKLREESKRMQALMELTREEAILSNQQLALSVSANEYQFEVLDEGQWKAISGDKIFRRRKITDGLNMSLLVEEVEVSLTEDEEEQTPASRIYFLSSGEITPFELVLRSADEAYERRLQLNEDGEVIIVKPEELF